ncbi:Hint domain-containing protein [Maritimibacter sp. UBA3975]|uniref:Hint domain-containing protein n=1 Tax=Maritimibacter sp. UBA3975 TaxID=1946833 RepID=UPI000C08F24F|nr:Hint domain-containing protein [Maritimibacter sp. UBA3975]MAM61616.1 hypothetical protein [Maritimibacter sp.]|tara:strand:+ start:8890 stop:10059 length:1170 start_codon:yes stop_codon:yes gene_type:complete
MGANNTPLYDLVELSSIGENRTFTTTPGGGGDIIGFVDNATYTDDEGGNSSTRIGELNETADADNGVLTIDGVDYNIQLADPDNTLVTVTYNGGANAANLSGDSGASQVVFIIASPLGGGSDRYFMAVDDSVGDLPDITSIQVRSLDWDPAGNDVKIDLDQNNNVTVCFAAGTRIDTPGGPCPVEDITPGDLVLTLDHGAQAVRWARAKTVPLDNRMRDKRNAPVKIRRGSLGAGMPARDLIVSPQHRVLVASKIAERIFGAREILVPAKRLIGLPGITRHRKDAQIIYCHLLFDRHEVIWADGAPAESLLPDKGTWDGLDPADRRAVLALTGRTFTPARPIVEAGAQIKELVRRHKKNAKPLVAASLAPARAMQSEPETPRLRVVGGD